MDWRTLSTQSYRYSVEIRLRTLPPEIGLLRRLVFLFLDRNRLETLPETLRTLPLRRSGAEFKPSIGPARQHTETGLPKKSSATISSRATRRVTRCLS